MGPQPGRKAFSLQCLPPTASLEETSKRVAKVAGFSLHAGVAAARHERQKLERLCRYDVQGSTSVARGRKPGATITRPAIAEPRLSLTPLGNVRYQLKTPYRDGTTHVVFEPLDCMARLAALAPRTLALLAGWALARPRVTNSPGANLNSRRLAPKGRGQEARVI